MNCPNCTAPMKYDEVIEAYICPACGEYDPRSQEERAWDEEYADNAPMAIREHVGL